MRIENITPQRLYSDNRADKSGSYSPKKITKRQFLTAAGALTAASILSACSNPDTQPTATGKVESPLKPQQKSTPVSTSVLSRLAGGETPTSASKVAPTKQPTSEPTKRPLSEEEKNIDLKIQRDVLTKLSDTYKEKTKEIINTMNDIKNKCWDGVTKDKAKKPRNAADSFQASLGNDLGVRTIEGISYKDAYDRLALNKYLIQRTISRDELRGLYPGMTVLVSKEGGKKSEIRIVLGSAGSTGPIHMTDGNNIMYMYEINEQNLDYAVYIPVGITAKK